MKQYRSYSIFINYNRFTEREKAAEINRLQNDFYFRKPERGRIGFSPGSMKLENIFSPQAKDYFAEQEAYRRLHGDVNDYMPGILEVRAEREGRLRDEIRKERATSESKNYENAVFKQLDVVRSTAIGRLLLDSIKSSVKIWIVLDQLKVGVASTTPGVVNDADGGGVRLHYEPDWFDAKMEYYTPDDVLFHELVHAYRAAKGEHIYTALPDYQTSEELLAVQMQNAYMAMRGKRRFYRSHSNPSLATKEEVYEGIASDETTLEAFNHFRFNEPLTARVAAITSPVFNAWRDADKINALAGKSASPIQSLGIPMTF